MRFTFHYTFFSWPGTPVTFHLSFKIQADCLFLTKKKKNLSLLQPEKSSFCCRFETWLSQDCMCQQFSLIIATNSVEINDEGLSDITPSGRPWETNHFPNNNSHSPLVWPFTAQPKNCLSLCQTQRAPLIPAVCFIRCQEAVLQPTVRSLPGSQKALETLPFCLDPW